MNRILKKKGFTLIEVLAVVVIIAILITCVTFAVSSSINNGRISSTTNSLQLFAADTENILAEYGVLVVKDGEPKAQVLEYLNLIENYYVHTYFNRDTLDISDSYFEIQTSTLVDGWDSPFKMRYCFNEESAGTCMLISPGPDLVFEDEYTTDNFGDDIMLIVYPKGI